MSATDQTTSVPEGAAPGPVRAMFWFFLVETGWSAVTALASLLATPLGSMFGFGVVRRLFVVERIGWLLFEVGALGVLVPFAMSRRGRTGGSLAAGSAVCAAAIVAIGLLSFAARSSEGFHSPPVTLTIWIGSALGHLGLALLLWSALTRMAPGRAPLSITATFFTLQALTALEALGGAVLFTAGSGRFNSLAEIGFGVSEVMSLAADVLLLVLLRRIRSDLPLEGASPGAAGQRDLIVGGVWLVGGLGITIASFASAAGGGRYVVTTGAIAYGLMRLIRGFGRMSKA